MTTDATDGAKSQPGPLSSTKRAKQSDADRAVGLLRESADEFQRWLIELIQSRKSFKLRLEVSGDRGELTDIDINAFKKRRPKHDPKPCDDGSAVSSDEPAQ